MTIESPSATLNSLKELRQWILDRYGDRRLKLKLKGAGRRIIRKVRGNIRKGEDVYGNRFTPLDPSYAEQKKGPGILRESLALYNSFFAVTKGDQLLVGNTVPYFAQHQFGSGLIPQRATLDAAQFIDVVLSEII
jgi:phage gpG-like protein